MSLLAVGLPAAETCVPAPSGLVSWWPGEGDATDVLGVNPGTLVNGVTFVPGKTGQGFRLNGSGAYIRVPDSSSLDLGGGLTVELWFKADDFSGRPLFDKRAGSASCNYGANLSSGTGIQLYYNDPAVADGDYPGSGFEISSHPSLPTAGEFHHFAGTYRQADATHIELNIYVDGQLQRSRTFLGSLANTVNAAALSLGSEGEGAGASFKGIIDEVSLYNRALSAGEIQAIAQAGSNGKCLTNVPPIIWTQPASQTVLEGRTATFTVTTLGPASLSYQWLFEGNAIAEATNASLVLSNVQPSQAGTYAVRVSNAAGSLISSNASLTIVPAAGCLGPPGLVSWWPGEGSAIDLIGTNNGELRNGVTFAPGIVGLGFLLDGVNDFVLIPDSVWLDMTNELTVELWFKADDFSGRPLFDKRAGAASCNYGANLTTGRGIQLYYNDPAVAAGDYPNSGFEISAHPSLPTTNEFHHFAGTYRQADATHIELNIYVDGQLLRSRTFLGKLANAVNTAPLSLGAEGGGAGASFKGIIDEVSLYNRALLADEIGLLFAAGSQGKCVTNLPPVIGFGPSSVTVTQGTTVSFAAAASGSPTLYYQWYFNGAPINDSTNTSLVLTNVQYSQAGQYLVVVSNSLNSATSTVATLTVLPPPTLVRVVNVSAASGGMIEVPVEMVASGFENAIGFSVQFNTNHLQFVGVDLHPDVATGAALLVNSHDLALGRLGGAVALPAGTTFSPGAQPLLNLSFTVTLVTAEVSTVVSFVDQPTIRQVADVLARPLYSAWLSGTVSVDRIEFEGDVAPRPAGDRTPTIADWVQLGRFAAGLDTPGSSSEFQRADCAPRGNRGNGTITVSDVVQSGRYAVGLDPLTPAGGPSEPPGGGGAIPRAAQLGVRALCTVNTTIPQGTTGSVAVTLEASGIENALGFSLSFDPTKLSLVSALVGPTVGSAVLTLNTNLLSTGKLGVILALSPGRTLSTGIVEVLTVRFAPLVPASTTAIIGFIDQPVKRETSDAQADALATDYSGGLVTVGPPPGPPLGVTLSGDSLYITWPSTAIGFLLEGTEAGLGTPWNVVPGVIDIGVQKLAIITITGTQRYFRLRKP